MGRALGVMIGGGAGAFAGILLLPDLTFLTMIIGALLGAMLSFHDHDPRHSAPDIRHDGSNE